LPSQEIGNSPPSPVSSPADIANLHESFKRLSRVSSRVNQDGADRVAEPFEAQDPVQDSVTVGAEATPVKGDIRGAQDEGSAAGAAEQSLLKFILAQPVLRTAFAERGAVVELRASGAGRLNSLLPNAATVEINSGDAAEGREAVQRLKGTPGLILLPHTLQFLAETRQFLGACFAKLAVGGLLIITVPHQFLYERKLRLPSRRNPLHRRFYTPNTLLADIEEAIDPCEYRVRFLADHDENYAYWANLESEPSGGGDIVVALEKIVRPPWREALGREELWTHAPTQPVPYLEVSRRTPAPIRTILPDGRKVGRILLLKLDHRGDFLMAGEAFKLLRNAFSSAEITLVCGSWNVAEARKIGLFDIVLAFDFFPEDNSAGQVMPSRELLIRRFAKEMSDQEYDLAVDLRLFDDTRDLLFEVKARHRAGFDRYDAFPWLTSRLNIPMATLDDRAERGLITANHFATSVCKHLGYEIRAEVPCLYQRWDSIIWGPYHELKPGRYQFECLMEPLGEEFEVPFDIVNQAATETIHAGVLSISRKRYPEFHVEVDKKLAKFEFRIVGLPNYELKPFRFFGLRFVRPSVIRGVHQAEAMALLAHLIELRLRNAYTTELL
jgi:hypothetical protein